MELFSYTITAVVSFYFGQKIGDRKVESVLPENEKATQSDTITLDYLNQVQESLLDKETPE
jgi:hypothetical protein